MRKNQTMWMKKAFARSKENPGLFHKQLGIPQGTKIPLTLLQKISDTKIGSTIKNPTQIGYRTIKITRLMKRRAVPLLTADRINK